MAIKREATTATPNRAPWGDPGWTKTGHPPHTAYQRQDFNEPRLLHLPLLRNVLNSLTSDVWLSLINSDLLMFQLPGFCCKPLWPPHAKSWLIGKDFDAGRDWGQEEKGTTEDEMAGWHHRLDRHEFGWTPGVGDGQGGLVCCNSWGRKESDMTERLNWTELIYTIPPL